MKRAAADDPTTAYARAVVAGDIPAGYPVRLACARHLQDLVSGDERGLWFDAAAADRGFRFYGLLKFAEGKYAGEPFQLQPFQCFIVGSLLGWKRADGKRRFRTAYIEIGKGSGKSPLAAGLGLYGLVADGEAGAEIYSAATGRDQARIVWTDAEKMVQSSPSLAKKVRCLVGNLSVPATHSFFRPVSSEHKGLDGKRPHFVLIDELHEHPDGLVTQKMTAGFKGRRQPLAFEITNSGYDRLSICWQHREYSIKVLEGVLPDDEWFAYVCQLDACDACRAEGKQFPSVGCPDCDRWDIEGPHWLKANPNLGVSIEWEYLRKQVREALGMPAMANIVMRLNFCIWTEQADRWIDMGVWDACAMLPHDEDELRGRAGPFGLDLTATTDLAAFVGFLPDGDGGGDVVAWFWMPEDAARRRTEKDRVPFDLWAAQGWITLTPGAVADYDQIRADINDIRERFHVNEIPYDPWNATQLSTQLEGDGCTMVQFRQGFISMSAPAKELSRLLAAKKVRPGQNPVLRWMASNVAISQDPAGNIKPDRARSKENIDGIVGLVMAVGRHIATAGAGESEIYSEGGLFVL